MIPQDFPVERLAQLEQDLFNRADSTRIQARTADARADHSAGFYDAAFAYADAAREVAQVSNAVIADLTRIAARQENPNHPWPLETLDNLSDVHRQDHTHLSEAWRERFPRWGVLDEGTTDSDVRALHLSAASAPVGGLLVHATRGVDHSHAGVSDTVMLNVSWEQWDDIVALAARIRAGLPVPFDTDGNTRGPQPQEVTR